MRAPITLYRTGPQHPEWRGRAVATATRLEFEFPAIAADNVGCAAVDSSLRPITRRYYWLATATYPGARYPQNHFQQVVLDFGLPPEALPTRSRLDSVFAVYLPFVAEAAGEPPMQIRKVLADRALATLEPATLASEQSWRVRAIIEGSAAIQLFLSAGADSVSLGWCQRDQWLTYLHVPLERR